MVLVNFAHPLTPEQLTAVASLAGGPVERVTDVPSQFDPAQPLAPQARGLVAGAGLSPAEWQTLPLLVNLPGHSTLAALVLAELHGRMGHFPAILRLRPVPGDGPTRFEVAEVLNLQSVRDRAREAR